MDSFENALERLRTNFPRGPVRVTVTDLRTGKTKPLRPRKAGNELLAENARLRAGLENIKTLNYDAGYSADEYAAAVLSGDEPKPRVGNLRMGAD